MIKWWRWLRSTEGQDLTEYALLIALMVVAALTAVTLFGTNVSHALGSVANTLSSVYGS